MYKECVWEALRNSPSPATHRSVLQQKSVMKCRKMTKETGIQDNLKLPKLEAPIQETPGEMSGKRQVSACLPLVSNIINESDIDQKGIKHSPSEKVTSCEEDRLLTVKEKQENYPQGVLVAEVITGLSPKCEPVMGNESICETLMNGKEKGFDVHDMESNFEHRENAEACGYEKGLKIESLSNQMHVRGDLLVQEQDMTSTGSSLECEVSNICHIEKRAKTDGSLKLGYENNTTLEPFSQNCRNSDEVIPIQGCFKRPGLVTHFKTKIMRGVRKTYIANKNKSTKSLTLCQDIKPENLGNSGAKYISNESLCSTNASTEGINDSNTSYIIDMEENTSTENQANEDNGIPSPVFEGNDTSGIKCLKTGNQLIVDAKWVSSETSSHLLSEPFEDCEDLCNFELYDAKDLCYILRRANAVKDDILLPIPLESVTLEIVYAAVNCGKFTDQEVIKWIKRIRRWKRKEPIKGFHTQLKLLRSLHKYITEVDRRPVWKSILQSSQYNIPKCNEVCVLFNTKDILRDEVLNFYKSVILGEIVSIAGTSPVGIDDDKSTAYSKCQEVRDIMLANYDSKQSLSSVPCVPCSSVLNVISSIDFVDKREELGLGDTFDEKRTEKKDKELGLSKVYNKRLNYEAPDIVNFQLKECSEATCGCNCPSLIRELCDIVDNACNHIKEDSVANKKVMGKKGPTYRKHEYKYISKVDKVLATFCQIVLGKSCVEDFRQILLGLYNDLQFLETLVNNNKAKLAKCKIEIKTKTVHIQKLSAVAKVANKRLESRHRRIRALEQELKSAKSMSFETNKRLKERITYLESELEKHCSQGNDKEIKGIGDKIKIPFEEPNISNLLPSEDSREASVIEVRSPVLSKLNTNSLNPQRMTTRSQMSNIVISEIPLPTECKNISERYQTSIPCIVPRSIPTSAEICDTPSLKNPGVSIKISQNSDTPRMTDTQRSSLMIPVGELANQVQPTPVLKSSVPNDRLLSGVAPNPGLFPSTCTISQTSELGHRPSLVSEIPLPSPLITEARVLSSVSHDVCIPSSVITESSSNSLSLEEGHKNSPVRYMANNPTPMVSDASKITDSIKNKVIQSDLQNEPQALENKDQRSLLECISQQNLLLSQNRNAARLQEKLLNQMCKDLLFYQNKACEQQEIIREHEEKVEELKDRLLHEEFRVCSLERRLEEIKKDEKIETNQRIVTVSKKGRAYFTPRKALGFEKPRGYQVKEHSVAKAHGNQAIEQSEHMKELEERLVSCSNIISDKNKSIRSLEEDITSRDSTIKSLETVINNLENQVKLLQEQIKISNVSATALEEKQREILQLNEKTKTLQKEIKEKNVSLKELQQEASYFAYTVLAQQKVLQDSGSLENSVLPSSYDSDQFNSSIGERDFAGCVTSRAISSTNHNPELIMLLKQRKNEMPKLISILRELYIRLREGLTSNNIFRDYLDLEMLLADVTLLIFSCIETDGKLGRFLHLDIFSSSESGGHEYQLSGSKLNLECTGKDNSDEIGQTIKTTSDESKCKDLAIPLEKICFRTSTDFAVSNKVHKPVLLDRSRVCSKDDQQKRYQLKCRKINEMMEDSEVSNDTIGSNRILGKIQDLHTSFNSNSVPTFETQSARLTPDSNFMEHKIVEHKKNQSSTFLQEQCFNESSLSFKYPDTEKTCVPKQLLIEKDLIFKMESIGMNMIQDKALSLGDKSGNNFEQRVVHNVYASEKFSQVLSLSQRKSKDGREYLPNSDKSSMSRADELTSLSNDSVKLSEYTPPEYESGQTCTEPSYSEDIEEKVNQLSCAVVIKRLQKDGRHKKTLEQQDTQPYNEPLHSDKKFKDFKGFVDTDDQETKVMDKHLAFSIVQKEKSEIVDKFSNRECYNEKEKLKSCNDRDVVDKDYFQQKHDFNRWLVDSAEIQNFEIKVGEVDLVDKVHRRNEGISDPAISSKKRERGEEEDCQFGKKRKTITCQSSFVSGTSEVRFESNFVSASNTFTNKFISQSRQAKNKNCNFFVSDTEKQLFPKKKKGEHSKRQVKSTFPEENELFGKEVSCCSQDIICKTEDTRIDMEKDESHDSGDDIIGSRESISNFFEARHVEATNDITKESGNVKGIFALTQYPKEMQVEAGEVGQCSRFDNRGVCTEDLLRNVVVAQLWRKYQYLENENKQLKEHFQMCEKNYRKKVAPIKERKKTLVKPLKERDDIWKCKEKTIKLLKNLEAEKKTLIEELRSREGQFVKEKALIEATLKSRIEENEKHIDALESKLESKMDVIKDQGNYIGELIREKAEVEKSRVEMKLKSKVVKEKEKYTKKFALENTNSREVLDIKAWEIFKVKEIGNKVKSCIMKMRKFMVTLENKKKTLDLVQMESGHSSLEENFDQILGESISTGNCIKVLLNDVVYLTEALIRRQEPKEMNNPGTLESEPSIGCEITWEATNSPSMNLEQRKNKRVPHSMTLRDRSGVECGKKEVNRVLENEEIASHSGDLETGFEIHKEGKLCKTFDMFSYAKNQNAEESVYSFHDVLLMDKFTEYESALKEREITIKDLQNQVEVLVGVKDEFLKFENLLEQTLGILSISQEKSCIEDLEKFQKFFSLDTGVTCQYLDTQQHEKLDDRSENKQTVEENTLMGLAQRESRESSSAKRKRILTAMMSVCTQYKELEGMVNKLYIEKHSQQKTLDTHVIENSELRKAIESLSFKNKEVQNSYEELQTQNQLLVETGKQIGEENRKLKNAQESWIIEKRHLQKLVETLEFDKEKLSSEVVVKEEENNIKIREVAEIENILKGEREKLSNLLVSNQKLLEEVSQKGLLASHYNNLLEKSKKSKRECDDNICELKKNLQESNQSIIALRAEIHNLERLYEMSCTEKQALVVTVNTLQNESNAFKGKVLDLEAELTLERNEHCKTLSSLESVRQEINEAVVENEKLMRAISKVQVSDEKVDLDEKAERELKEKRLLSEIDDLKSEATNLRKSIVYHQFQYLQVEREKDHLSYKLKEEENRFKALLKQKNLDWRKEYSILATQFNEISEYNSRLIDQMNHWNEFKIMLCRALNIKVSHELSNSPNSQDIEYIRQFCDEQKHLENKMKNLKSALWEEQLRNEKLGKLLHEEQSKVYVAESKVQELEVEIMNVKKSFEEEQTNNLALNMKLQYLEGNGEDLSVIQPGPARHNHQTEQELQVHPLSLSTTMQEAESKIEIAEAFAHQEQVRSKHLIHVVVDMQHSNESLKETLREERSQYLKLLTEVSNREQDLEYQTRYFNIRLTDKECQTYNPLDKVYKDEVAKIQYSLNLEQMSSHYFCKTLIGECRDFKENLELWLSCLNASINKQRKRKEQFKEMISAVTGANLF
ncbi:golgin subfamily B member 1-like [Palaemon carinicauda]|uniref:golgin subfamily B member 1-like n=1 Tax=Palaemon carinicauda TaxID=392227 RepID=UPI0035B5F956